MVGRESHIIYPQTSLIPSLGKPIIPNVMVGDFCLRLNGLKAKLERYSPIRLVNVIPIKPELSSDFMPVHPLGVLTSPISSHMIYVKENP